MAALFHRLSCFFTFSFLPPLFHAWRNASLRLLRLRSSCKQDAWKPSLSAFVQKLDTYNCCNHNKDGGPEKKVKLGRNILLFALVSLPVAGLSLFDRCRAHAGPAFAHFRACSMARTGSKRFLALLLSGLACRFRC